MKKILIILSLFYYAICESVGGYAGSPFNYGSHAKEVSMSKSLIAVRSNAFRTFSNPALLSNIKTIEYGLSYFSMSLDRSIQVFSLSIPIESTAGINISYFRSGVDDITLKSLNNYNVGSYNHSEGFGMLSFANSFKKISFGINVKYYFNNFMEGYSGSGAGVDIGFEYKINKKVNLGFVG